MERETEDWRKHLDTRVEDDYYCEYVKNSKAQQQRVQLFKKSIFHREGVQMTGRRRKGLLNSTTSIFIVTPTRCASTVTSTVVHPCNRIKRNKPLLIPRIKLPGSYGESKKPICGILYTRPFIELFFWNDRVMAAENRLGLLAGSGE